MMVVVFYFQTQTFTNFEVKKGSFIGFHYNANNRDIVVVPYTYHSGDGSHDQDKFGSNLGTALFESDITVGMMLNQSQLDVKRRIPMASFYVNSPGKDDQQGWI